MTPRATWSASRRPAEPAARCCCAAAFGLDGTQIRLRASKAPQPASAGFAMALTVSRPVTVNSLIDAGFLTDPDGHAWAAVADAKPTAP
ncbi:hypothetical protein NKH18_13200 [Streptomyces sp. M10(2022)]